MKKDHVVVLGAGLQGVSAALALQSRGHQITLIEKARDCLLHTSAKGEGKIHLGLVYVNDESFRTSKLMLAAALRFAPLLEAWLKQQIPWQQMVSTPYSYVIARDSMLPVDKILTNYERLQSNYENAIKDTQLNYLGQRPERLWWNEADPHLAKMLNGEFARKTVLTAELALSREKFSRILRSAIKGSDSITKLYHHELESISRTGNGFHLSGKKTDGTAWSMDTGLVVNCLWQNRLKFDAQLGYLANRPWVYRLKYRLLGQLPDALSGLPSMTIVVGPYGDIVTNPLERVYFSWYPTCLQGWSSDLQPPQSWADAFRDQPNPELKKTLIRDSLQGFANVVPGLDESKIDTVGGCVICSWGDSDITDPVSELHQRYDIGVHAYDGYFSIDTGKLTCAPYFAEKLLEQIV